MNTRNADTTDAAAISDFVCKIAIEHIAPSLTEAGLEKLLDSMSANSTRQRIDDGWPHICAFDGDALLGVVVVKPPTHLYHLFVRTDSQKSGIGKKLFLMADDWSTSVSGEPLATVNSSLNAIHIYNRLGFDSDGPIIDTDGVRYQPMARQNTGQKTSV